MPRKKKKDITCREKLAIDHPEYVGVEFIGGCCGCPHLDGYASIPESCRKKLNCSEDRCRECWDRPVEEVK